MNISLTPELDHWVEEKVKSGLYRSSSELIREGLRLLIRKEEQRQAMLDDLKAELLIGLKQLDAGKAAEFDSELLQKIKTDAGKNLGA